MLHCSPRVYPNGNALRRVFRVSLQRGALEQGVYQKKKKWADAFASAH
jgi:hypothetical protein